MPEHVGICKCENMQMGNAEMGNASETQSAFSHFVLAVYIFAYLSYPVAPREGPTERRDSRLVLVATSRKPRERTDAITYESRRRARPCNATFSPTRRRFESDAHCITNLVMDSGFRHSHSAALVHSPADRRSRAQSQSQIYLNPHGCT